MMRSLEDRLRWMPAFWARLRGLGARSGPCRKPKVHVKDLSDHMLRDLGLGDKAQDSQHHDSWR